MAETPWTRSRSSRLRKISGESLVRWGDGKITRKDEGDRRHGRFTPAAQPRNLGDMKRRLLFALLALALLLLALAGWAVQGLRWAVGGESRRRGRLATA